MSITLVIILILSVILLTKYLFDRFVYYCKFSLFIGISLVSATLPIPLMLLRPRNSRNALIPAFGARCCGKLIGLNVTVDGHENIPENCGCLVLINHQSALDLIVLAHLWPLFRNCSVISKKEVFYLWPFGLATWLWGTIFIDRLNSERAQKTVNSTGQLIKNRKIQILVFPEGTRNCGDELLPFKKGSFHLAISSQCPILPVIVSKYNFLNHSSPKFESGNVKINILPPIVTDNLTTDDIDDLMTNTYNQMNDCFRSCHDSNNNNHKTNLNVKHS